MSSSCVNSHDSSAGGHSGTSAILFATDGRRVRTSLRLSQSILLSHVVLVYAIFSPRLRWLISMDAQMGASLISKFPCAHVFWRVYIARQFSLCSVQSFVRDRQRCAGVASITSAAFLFYYSTYRLIAPSVQIWPKN